MASKKSTVYVIDRSESMGHCHEGRTETDLEWGIKYVTDDIGNRILSERKTDQVAVVSVTGDSGATVESELKQFLFEDYQKLKDLTVAGYGSGDLVDGLISAIDVTTNGTAGVKGNKLKYQRMIIVLTNGKSPMNFETSQWNDALNILLEWEIDVRFLVIDKLDLDVIKSEDAESSVKEEQDSVKKEELPEEEEKEEKEKELAKTNIAKLETLCDSIKREASFVASYDEAIWSMSRPKPKEVVVTARSYVGTLTLGESGTDMGVSINVIVYPMTRVAAPISAKSFALASDGKLMDVGIARDYLVVEDESKPEDATTVNSDQIDAGYPYGSEIIPVSEHVEQLLGEFGTTQSMEIVGFVDAERVDRWALMGSSDFVVASKDRDSIALSSFVRSMYEEDKRAVARYVRKDNVAVQMVLLSPYFDIDFESLVMCPLPFADDVRKYQFPSLDRFMTRSGNAELPENHPQRVAREPTHEMLQLMESVVESMDLMDVDVNENESMEFAVPEETFNPVIHKVRQAIKECALSGDTETLPTPLPILFEASRPPQSVVDKSSAQLERLHTLFDLKKVEKKKTIKQEASEMEAKLKAPKTGLDLDLLFA